MIRIDANVVLRFFIKDILDQAFQAKNILENENVLITNEVIAEIIYVLEKVYKKERDYIYYALYKLIIQRNILNFDKRKIDKRFVLKALEIYKDTKLDFVDCLLCAYGEVDEIVTFDKKLI
ncbi:MAG: PIN domain-containing protein, partial [Nautiliaceae bacterium]